MIQLQSQTNDFQINKFREKVADPSWIAACCGFLLHVSCWKKSLVELFSPIRIKCLLFRIPTCWKLRISEDLLENPASRGWEVWETGRALNSVPYSPSGFSCPSSLELTLYLLNSIPLLLLLSLINVLCSRFCSHLSTKTVFSVINDPHALDASVPVSILI